MRDRVDYLEVVQNGKVVHEVRLDEYKNRQGSLPPVEFQDSGWMLVRAVTTNSKTFRFASTGPYYVQIGDRPRISRQSAEFFLDWVNERTAHLQLDDPQQRNETLAYLERVASSGNRRSIRPTPSERVNRAGPLLRRTAASTPAMNPRLYSAHDVRQFLARRSIRSNPTICLWTECVCIMWTRDRDRRC